MIGTQGNGRGRMFMKYRCPLVLSWVTWLARFRVVVLSLSLTTSTTSGVSAMRPCYPAIPQAEARGGEAFAKGLGGGIFSWSYYGTSEGMEQNTRDTYTEHVMRCQWGRTVDTMQSWMVARRYESVMADGYL